MIKPFVTIATPTFNRRIFFPLVLCWFQKQTYPRDRLEWIIYDDGTDSIEDIIKESNISEIRYFKSDVKETVSSKRNFINSKAKGDIIVNIDDDDYYSVDRISYAVDMFLSNPTLLFAGCRTTYIYFTETGLIYRATSSNKDESTAGTFVYRRELLEQTSYNNNRALAEEQDFLKDNKFEMIDLDPMRTMLVISHGQNSFDKKIMLEVNKDPVYFSKTEYKLSDFVKDNESMTIILGLNTMSYPEGSVELKLDVMEERERIRKQVDELLYNVKLQYLSVGNGYVVTDDSRINMKKEGYPDLEFGPHDIVRIINGYEMTINQLKESCIGLLKEKNEKK